MQSYNIIDGLESNSYTWRKANPASPVGVPTSEVETRTYSGHLTYLRDTVAPTLLSDGSEACQVACSLTARGGGMAELTVTRTWYSAAAGEGGGGDDSGGSGGSGGNVAGEVGSSSDNPVYSFQVTENRIPILLHPLIEEAGVSPSSAQGIALRMLANGADENATFTVGSADNPTPYTVGLALEHVPDKVKTLVASQSSYLSPGLVLEVRWQIKGDMAVPQVSDFFKIATPEGNISTPSDRNWLLAGGGAVIENGRVYMSKKYILSEPGGWDKTLYS